MVLSFSQNILNKIKIIKDKADFNPEYLIKMTFEESKSKIKILDIYKPKNFGAIMNEHNANYLNKDFENLKSELLNNFCINYSTIRSYLLSSEDEIQSHKISHGIDKENYKNSLKDPICFSETLQNTS